MENNIQQHIQDLSDKDLRYYYKNRAKVSTYKRELIEIEFLKRGGNDKLNQLGLNNTNPFLSQTYKIHFSILILILLMTLPFHYMPSEMKVFPKDNLSFSYTIITKEDIDKMVKRYNDCENIFQQQSISTEPLFRKLSDQGLIQDKKRNN